jgi:anti-sigma-K factor RskA
VSITRTRAALVGLWDKAWFWRGLAAGLGVVALALLVAALIGRAPPDFSARAIVAIVRDPGGQPLWAIRLASGADQIAADSLAPPPVAAGRVYQLWLEAPGAGGPRPLGLLPRTGRKTIAETPANIRLLAGRGELVVTVEPPGGSRGTGPSGPVRFRGALAGPG